MVVDGKAIAEKIKASLREEVLRSGKKLRLAVIVVGGDTVTEKFLEQKKKFAAAIGADVHVYDFPADISTTKLREKISEVVRIKENTGVIIQLPLPPHINTPYILDAIMPEKDPDLLSSKSWGAFAAGKNKILPPVVGAIKKIFQEYDIEPKGKSIAVIGAGRLVGKPAALWLMSEGATVTVIDENSLHPARYTLHADIIISGVGKAGLITRDMVKEGAVIIDAGTSESGGSIKGDVEAEAAERASVFSPVPGGVGPVAVAMLFQNLVALSK